MAYRVELSSRAIREAEEARDWIAQDSPRRAAAWYQRLLDKIESLKEYPERCPLAPESDAFEEKIRQLLYGKRRGVYRVLFAVRGEVVYIFSIRHSARDFLEP